MDFHILRELGVKLLQFFIGNSIAVNQRKEFLNLGNDALCSARGEHEAH